jgi:AAA15 family ATPase/GTPase
MKITRLQLTNFKRFTDLTIDNIPISARLVLLIGSNGSGKSSVFDAFGLLDGAIKGDVPSGGDDYWQYFQKQVNTTSLVAIKLDNQAEIKVSRLSYANPGLLPFTFYGRTSFRQIPRLTRTSLGQGQSVDFEKDSDRAKFFIDRDNRFENDIERITGDILKDFFRLDQSRKEISSKYIDPINRALENIFGSGNGTKLQLIEIIPPLEGKTAQINFRKGVSEIHYNYLSAGEKEVVNLLSRRELYQDTIYFLDEIDLHLNTKLQFSLLKEITENWIPANCQLWTATHSLGFIEYAKQTEEAIIIDFDDLDFDMPQVLSPMPKDNPDVYEIAVGKEFLPQLFQHMTFVADKNRDSVYHKARTGNYRGLVDRDFLSDSDILEVVRRYPNLSILHYYSLENYLFHPDNLEEYYNTRQSLFDKEHYIRCLTEEKNKVKGLLIMKLISERMAYPYFKEPENTNKALENRFLNKSENHVESEVVASYLESNEFEIFYKSLPMKTYCTQLPQRQNVRRPELAKTQWFRTRLAGLLGIKND